MRIAKLRFCERWRCFTDATGLHLPDGRVEIALGDLCSDEETSLTLDLEVLPLPLFASGKPATSLEREELLAIEILWDQIGAAAVRSRVRRQTIRILPAQDPLDVVLDERVIPWPEEGACR